MNKLYTILAAIMISSLTFGQSYPPAAGQPGSTAIHKDSSIIIGWATQCQVVRGWMQIEDQSMGLATFGTESEALGQAEGVSTSVISLGDGGMATVQFLTGISNGPGPDFAVFENGLIDEFLELAFVEVSSDGVRFVRFPAVSETPVSPQIASFGMSNPAYLHNFAGKYRIGYGTPFDLEDLIDSTGIDLQAISHVRIVDVVGSIDPAFATYDSQGNIVNNTHPTPFESSGFDLDGVGVIHAGPLSIKNNKLEVSVFPNPTQSYISTNASYEQNFTISTIDGKVVISGSLTTGINRLDVQPLQRGSYILQTQEGQAIFQKN